MKKVKETNLLLKFNKAITLAVCVLLLCATQITPLSAQLSPARDLTGTWQSSIHGMYYSLDPTDPTLRMNDVTATFSMDITQQGSQITIILHLNMISYVVDPAYWNEYGFGIPEVGGGAIRFVGTVSSSSFSTVEQDTSFSPEHLDGTFTTDIITATLSGDSFQTDTNGIVVTRTGSPTSTPTQGPMTTPTSTSTSGTPPPTNPDNLGTVGLVRGSAWLKNSGGETQLTSKSQVGAGSQVRTGSDTIVSFSYPDQGGTVYLGGNTEVGWVGLESHPAPDSQVTFTPLPSDLEHSFDWGEEGTKLLTWTLAGAGAEMLLTGAINPYLLGAEVAVHGGIILVHYGQFYIRENGWPQLIQVPQGFIQGENTEYSIVVTNDTTVIQVIDGPLVFLDPISSNSVTVNTGQMLTLPAAQQNGFTQQNLQSDVSAFNPASTDQWWTQANSSSPLSFLTDQPVILAVLVLAIALVIAVSAITVVRRRKSGFTQPGVTRSSAIYAGKSYGKDKLIVQSVIAAVVFAVVGYVLIIVLNSTVGGDEELVAGISFSTFLEVTIIMVMALAYVGSLVQQIRLYRSQQPNMPPPPPATASEIKSPTYKMASQPAQPTPQQPRFAFCPNCGKQLGVSKKYCPICGFELHPEPAEK